jgi:hypothetical protein
LDGAAQTALWYRRWYRSRSRRIGRAARAARKLIYLAVTSAVPAWTKTRAWTKALLAFKTHFGDRPPD